MPRRSPPARRLIPRPGARQSPLAAPAGWEPTTASGLERARLALLVAVTARLTRLPQVALYVLVEPGGDACAPLEAARTAAHWRGWHVGSAFVEQTGMTDPLTRPVLCRVHEAIASRRVDGIMTATAGDISAFPGPYIDELSRLQAHGGFLAHAQPPTLH